MVKLGKRHRMIVKTPKELIEILQDQWVNQGQGDEPLMWEFVGRRHCENYLPNISKKDFTDIVSNIDEEYIAGEFHDCIKNLGGIG